MHYCNIVLKKKSLFKQWMINIMNINIILISIWHDQLCVLLIKVLEHPCPSYGSMSFSFLKFLQAGYTRPGIASTILSFQCLVELNSKPFDLNFWSLTTGLWQQRISLCDGKRKALVRLDEPEDARDITLPLSQLRNHSNKGARSSTAAGHLLFVLLWCLSALFRAHKYNTV